MIKAAIFDLDHTLFDRYSTLRKAISEADEILLPFKNTNDREILAEIMVEFDKNYILFGWDRVFKELNNIGVFKENVTSSEIFVEYIHGLFMKYAVEYDFSKKMLETLRSSGIKVGLITNGSHILQSKKLEILNLKGCFDEILISGDTPYSKPDVRIFEMMKQRMGLKAKEMLYVGDHPLNDVYASEKAGYIPVWVRTSGLWLFDNIDKPKFQVDTVAEIPGIIRIINKLEA